MEENTKTVETVATTEPQKVETTQGEKKLTQEEVDKIVTSRLARERETIAKTLGLESYDKDAVKTYAEQFNELRTKSGALNEQLETTKKEYEGKLTNAQNELLMYKYQIKEDKFDDAITLAQKRSQSSDISIEEALGQVVSEFPNLKGASLKGGIEAGNVSTPPENRYVTENLQKKYPFLKK
jgi:hypothetical protein